jgi:SAM-dependent methyltransferase
VTGGKRYDRAYFDRWYRDPRRRVRGAAELRRDAALVVAVAEHVLGRPLRTVLDVGCGEGAWEPALRRLRPAVRYRGLDPSEYAVRRFGARRGIRLGGLTTLDALRPARPADLVICADVLHYLDAPTLERGIPQLARRVGGVAYLPLFTSEDEIEGDRSGWHERPRRWYRRLFAGAGLVPCGLHCYLPAERALELASMELPGAYA